MSWIEDNAWDLYEYEDAMYHNSIDDYIEEHDISYIVNICKEALNDEWSVIEEKNKIDGIIKYYECYKKLSDKQLWCLGEIALEYEGEDYE